MTPERWQQVKELFQSVVEREVSQRAAFLDEACAGDPDLRRELDILLASDERAENFLEAPAARLRSDQPAESLVGRRIGPYQILHEIARGGMGAVYLAERADDQFQKQVAIKIVKRGMDSDSILRRFRNEQKILANLDHPNIARLIDGGTTEDGLSYFIMDYVEGLPIDGYCDTHRLHTLERLKLFRTVCSAVEYAHQHHVVHRDLKPSNILVTGDGVPRLLDFGIAKVLSPDEASHITGLTGALRLMTPRYASPEQVRGEPVTPASDLYSLGVVLYELLSGHYPYRLQSHTPQEIERVIREEEPEKPSTAIHRVEEVSGADGMTRITLTPESVSETREGQPEKLRRRLTGDLDNIALMALRKEPERRYASGAQLSEDIRRHLEGRPVIARHDTLVYRSAKFIKRNQASVIALLVTVIVVGLINAGLYLLPRRDKAIDNAINSDAKIAPFTALRGNEFRPTFSPDGNQIAFAWDGEKEDNPDIYVKQLGNESLHRLTTNPAADTKPCWSPDGRYIAFARELPEGVELYLIPSLGGAERRIMQPSSAAMIDQYQISWSPDSEWLAVSDQGSIFLVARDTGEKRKLTSPPSILNGDGSAAISPDGKTVAFFRNYDLCLVPTAGGEPKLLVSNTARSKSPAWTPDGREILFLSTRSGDSSLSLWRVPATGGTPEQVVAAGQNLHSFAVSRDGQRLAWTQTTIGDQNIWRMELTGGAAGPRQAAQSAKLLIYSTRGEGGGQISPDGKKIVFSSDRSGNHEIWVADSTGAHQVQLTTFNRDVTSSPRWSPDGRQIVFDSRAEGNADIYVISAEGGQPRRLTTDPGEDVTPFWSRDGNSIYFCSTRGGSRDIWKIPATGGEAVMITKQSEAYQCVESPDGRFLYYQKRRFMAGIWRVRVAGGDETLILDHHRAGYWRQWTVVEQGIYFATAERPEQALIEFFSFATGRVTPVAILQRGFDIGSSGLSVSPDGRWLIWSQIDQIGHDIMLMENFR